MTVAVLTHSETRNVEGATQLEVIDGNLWLSDDENADLAVFAPGEWLNAIKSRNDLTDPRRWQSLNDVPRGVKVKDSSGDVWDLERVGFTDRSGSWTPVHPIREGDYSAWNLYAPFIEEIA